MIRVVVADDQTAVREGLALLLDLLDDVTVVGAARDGDEAVALVAAHAPDVVLMDLRMPGVSEATVKSHINRLFAKAGVARPGAGGQLRVPPRASREVSRAFAAGHSASVMP